MAVPTLRGKVAEDVACGYLENHGLTLLERNYRCRRGELDLIMRDGAHVVFVEVRCRGSHRYGTPAETVTKTKQRRLSLAAARYLQHRRIDSPCRFDIVAISRDNEGNTVQWIKDAFRPG